MPAPRRAARRRLARRPALVGPALGGAIADLLPRDAGDEEWGVTEADGWRSGLTALGYLRSYFPAFFAAHVAPQRLTTERLLGAAHAFLILGHRDLIALDLVHACPIDLEVDPAAAPSLIDGYRDEGGILTELGGAIARWLFDPPPLVYGTDPSAQHEAWRQRQDQLGVTLTCMLAKTSWAAAWPAAAYLRGPADLPVLPAATDVRRLAEALTWSAPLDGVAEPWRLGDLLRYLASTTGNEYADYCADELAEDGAWWLARVYDAPERLAYERERQRGARRLAATYAALSARCDVDAALLAAVVAQIAQAAETIEEVACAA